MGSYLRPATVPDALAALAVRPGLQPLAGGTDYYPSRSDRAPDDDILDLGALSGLRGFEARPDHWWVPCLATWTDLLEADLPPLFDCLKQAARQVGGVQIQNTGTLVGNLCNASPAADGIPCLLALDASVELASSAGTRSVPVAEFLLGPRKTARQPHELALGLRIPRVLEQAGSRFLKLGARRYLVISIAMVAAVIARAPDGRITAARIAVGACSATARRLPALEAGLIGTTGDFTTRLEDHLTPIDDIRGTAAYRLHAAETLVRRAVAA